MLNVDKKIQSENIGIIKIFEFLDEPVKLDFKPSSSPIGPQNGVKISEVSEGKCEPKLECIPNPLTKDLSSSATNQFALPDCINIHRCGGFGCCSENENCMSIKQETIILKNVIF